MSTILYTGDLEGARDSVRILSQRVETMSANVATLINAITNLAVHLDSVKELSERTSQENEKMKKTVSELKKQLDTLTTITEEDNEHS